MRLDCLAIAAHPDDGEISAGGTLLTLARAGHAIGIVDLTAGESGTRGDQATRAAETDAASEKLGLALRHNLGLPDGRVVPTVEAREELALLIRRHRPRLILAHHTQDLHPDHAAAGTLARQAWYLAGLAKLGGADTAPAHRPERILHFMSHERFEPTMVVDIGPVWKDKLDLVRCFASQLRPQTDGDRGEHFLFGADILERVETKARFWGERIGVRYGEPLLHRGPIP
ncbi:MAG: bacillithiol biosynthesis deacetylase BshB1, partial [Planctomycetota bacterium]|nr:bacillithiol biosynthesis deacetylase BshB1 [Planctomycetota bacterium]